MPGATLAPATNINRNKHYLKLSFSSMKRCSKCREVKPETDFYKKGKHLHSKCIPCHKAYHASWYREHPGRREIVRKAQIKFRRNIRDYIRELKDNKACMDCKISYPHYVLDYDHRPGENKLYNVSNIASRINWNKDKIDQEIAKCDLVCANCHRIRTWKRSNTPL